MELSLLTLETYSKEKLIDYLNEFINHDFSKVVQLLYRIDVSEAKLKKVLQENPNEDAAGLIADLIIERIAIAQKQEPVFQKSIPTPKMVSISILMMKVLKDYKYEL